VCPLDDSIAGADAAARLPSRPPRRASARTTVLLLSRPLLSPTPTQQQTNQQRLWSTTFCGQPAVAKQRIRKRYRHPDLDARLTASRLRAEARAMARARKLGVPSPALYQVELPAATIYMERVDGHSVKALLSGGALALPDVGEDAAATAAAEEARDEEMVASGGSAAALMAAAAASQRAKLQGGAAPPPLVPPPQAAQGAGGGAAAATAAAAASSTATTTERATLALMRELGRVVARLHDGGLVHGDLTTSNVLVRGTESWLDPLHGRAVEANATGAALAALEAALAERERRQAAAAPGGRGSHPPSHKPQPHATADHLAASKQQHPSPPHPPVVLIDYGLASNSTLPEDKAVDLYVLERALGSAHPRAARRLFEAVLEGYRSASQQWSATWNRFAEVRLRGRKRTMVG
jgi:TP53 regulating kinase-like protein